MQCKHDTTMKLGLHVIAHCQWQWNGEKKLVLKKLSSILNENIRWHCMPLELNLNEFKFNWIRSMIKFVYFTNDGDTKGPRPQGPRILSIICNWEMWI